MIITQPLEITTPEGQATGRWRLVELSDEHEGAEPLCDCGGIGGETPGHESPEAALACPVASARRPLPTVPELAALAFEAYNAHAGGRTWDGKPIPSWDTLCAQGSPVCGHWEAAAEAMLKAVGR